MSLLLIKIALDILVQSDKKRKRKKNTDLKGKLKKNFFIYGILIYLDFILTFLKKASDYRCLQNTHKSIVSPCTSNKQLEFEIKNPSLFISGQKRKRIFMYKSNNIYKRFI